MAYDSERSPDPWSAGDFSAGSSSKKSLRHG